MGAYITTPQTYQGQFTTSVSTYTARGYTAYSDAYNAVSIFTNRGNDGYPLDPKARIEDITGKSAWNSAVRMEQYIAQLATTGEYYQFSYGTDGRATTYTRTHGAVIDTNSMCKWNGVRASVHGRIDQGAEQYLITDPNDSRGYLRVNEYTHQTDRAFTSKNLMNDPDYTKGQTKHRNNTNVFGREPLPSKEVNWQGVDMSKFNVTSKHSTIYVGNTLAATIEGQRAWG